MPAGRTSGGTGERMTSPPRREREQGDYAAAGELGNRFNVEAQVATADNLQGHLAQVEEAERLRR